MNHIIHTLRNKKINDKASQDFLESTTDNCISREMGIYYHKKAATHFVAAASSHMDAALHHEAGDHEQAAISTIIAHGHACIAEEAQREDIKYHTSNE